MKNGVFENRDVRETLRRAYFARGTQSLTRQWQEEVMARVRKTGRPLPFSGFWTSFEATVWRLAPVNILLILILLWLNMGFDTGYDLLGTAFAEFVEPSLSAFFGVEG